MEISTRVETIQVWKMDKETHFAWKFPPYAYWAIFHLISPTVIVVQVINDEDTHEKAA